MTSLRSEAPYLRRCQRPACRIVRIRPRCDIPSMPKLSVWNAVDLSAGSLESDNAQRRQLREYCNLSRLRFMEAQPVTASHSPTKTPNIQARLRKMTSTSSDARCLPERGNSSPRLGYGGDIVEGASGSMGGKYGLLTSCRTVLLVRHDPQCKRREGKEKSITYLAGNADLLGALGHLD